jgi:ABC-type enterobactin transport system permease subunit
VVKQVNLPEVATSLFYGGALSGDAKFEAIARKVLAKR